MKAVLLAFALLTAPAFAADSRSQIAARPDLFSAETGLRVGRYRAPTPDDVPLAEMIDGARAKALAAEGAVFIDVMAAPHGGPDPLDGSWPGDPSRETIPGALWLPETGRGSLTREMSDYFRKALESAAKGERTRPIVIFCIPECWMGWNGAQRAARLGYGRVYWLRDGVGGWTAAGGALESVRPAPVTTP